MAYSWLDISQQMSLKFESKQNNFQKENAFQNVCNMSAILFWAQSVKWWISSGSNKVWCNCMKQQWPGIVLCMQPANEKQHYNVTSFLIGWEHAQNDPWMTNKHDALKSPQRRKFNSLAPGRCGSNFKSVISKHIIWWINFMSTSCEIVLKWMPQNTFNEKSTLVQITAWYCQATSHYLSHCWPISMSPYHVTRPQWVNSLPP